ncbi:hypothetical protein CHUAL_010877 [Chamberlinius hualienensis]
MKSIVYVVFSLLALAYLCESTGGSRSVGGYGQYDQNSNSGSYTSVRNTAERFLIDQGYAKTDCGNGKIQPSSVQTQVVAGTNWKMTYSIPSECSGNSTPFTCSVVVYQNLPHTKQPPIVNEDQTSCHIASQ